MDISFSLSFSFPLFSIVPEANKLSRQQSQRIHSSSMNADPVDLSDIEHAFQFSENRLKWNAAAVGAMISVQMSAMPS